MTPAMPQHPDDATLVAWLDGELPATTAEQLARTVAADGDLFERVRMLRAARAEFAWALSESDSTPPPATLARLPAPRRNLSIWLLAAAAVCVVAVIGYRQSDAQFASAENQWLAVKLSSPRAGWDLFSNIRFVLEGQAKTATPCRIISRGTGETDQQMALRAVAENGGAPVVAMELTAELTAELGSGKRIMPGRVALVDSTFGASATKVSVPLIDVRTGYDGIAPLLTLQFDDEGGSEDFQWGFQHGVTPEAGEHGFVPTEVGEYRLRLQLRALATDVATAPLFAEPLDVAIGFAVRGVVGEWSEAIDGMRARIVASRAATAGKPLAVAVQLRNDSDRARSFNITGSTMAKIPQPFHFDLFVDGQQWRQREGLAVTTAARWLALPQPIHTTRSVVTLASYWEATDPDAAPLHGRHQLGFRFHFEPSVWNNGDQALWMGKIDTPTIEVEFPERP